MELRDYQIQAVKSIEAEWERGTQSTLCCVATGGGKTAIACELMKNARRSLFLVNKRDLALDTVKRLKKYDIDADLEMGELRAGKLSRVTVATVQSLISGVADDKRRFHKFEPNDFSLLVLDEVHHAPAKSWITVINHFREGNKELRVVGLTATPDRHDGKALSQICDSVAVNIPIRNMIDDGWLVEVDQRIVKVESLDFDKIKIVAGDFSSGELDRMLRENQNLYSMATATLGVIGERSTILFAKTIDHAEAMAHILNAHKPNSTAVVSQRTEYSDRVRILHDFSNGKIQILCNVAIVGEGIDLPNVQVIVQGAPTLSRSKYAQQIGRALRPVPGIVDGLETPQERRAAILQSHKPTATVLDFVGNSTRHKLVSVVDVLGGKISEEAKILAVKRMVESGEARNAWHELTEAEIEIKRQIEERKKDRAKIYGGITARSKYRLTYIDPFEDFQHRREHYKHYRRWKVLSLKEKRLLIRNGHDPDRMDFDEARAKIKKIIGATDAQMKVLLRAGYSRVELEGVTRWDASKIIGQCAANNWKRPA